MQLFCPNKSNKNIKAEYEELESALGEDLAHLVWQITEGEGLGNHPGLTDSVQFSEALTQTGDRISALKRLANISMNNHFNKNATSTSVNSILISEDIDRRRKDYINSVVDNYKKTSKLKGKKLLDSISTVRDKAREQFDLNEIDSIKRDDSIQEAELNISIDLLRRDLEIVKGIQQINKISEKTTDTQVFEQIVQGTKTRLKSQLSRNIKNTKLINDIKEQIVRIEGIDQNNIDQILEQVKLFLLNAEQEILKTRKFIDSELLSKDISKWDPQQINYIKYDLIGYYEGLLSTLYTLFKGDSDLANLNRALVEQDSMTNPDLQELSSSLYNIISLLQIDYQDRVVKPYAEKILTDFVNNSDVVENKEQFIKNMKSWLDQDTIYGDIAAGEVAIGMASRSRSDIIRIVEKVISDTEFERNRAVLKTGQELISLYNKIRPVGSQIDFRNFQKMFIELDGEDGTSGMPTGYFVRDRNYGRLYKEKDQFERSLREKYKDQGLKWRYNEMNDSIELIFPDEDCTKPNSVYNKYYDELDKWLCDHCERRYTLEYYKQKRRILSPMALQAQSFIQRQIDLLSYKAMTKEGFVDENKLTTSERSRLNDLRVQKRELASPYIFKSLSDGTVVLKSKTGDDAIIADQIRRWNAFIADHVKYKKDEAKFQAALSTFEKGSVEYKRFIRNNVISRINPKFWEIVLGSSSPKTSSAKYKDLAYRYRTIVDHIKNKPGFSIPNLDLLGTGINTDTSAWEELHRLEQEMADEKGQSSSMSKNDFDDYIVSTLITSTKEEKPFLNMLIERWYPRIVDNNSNADVFDSLFRYKDAKGRIRYLKIFSFLSPREFTIKDPQTGESIPTTIETYSSQFSELDESSDFVNSNWDKTLGESLQPKVRRNGTKRRSGVIDYTNENYYAIQGNEGYKEFYRKLLSVMSEANSYIPQRALTRSYLMPQITGRQMSIYGRSRSVSDMFNAINYQIQDWTALKVGKSGLEFDDSLMERSTDVSTNIDLPRRPDGSIVNNIPIRFIKRLEDPRLISTDIIGSVMMFYDMALNFKLKSEKLPGLEMIKEAIDPEKDRAGKRLYKQYEKYKDMLDYRVYGKESRLGSDETKAYSKVEKSTMQIAKKFRSLASMSMLALNFTTIEVGYLDAFLGSFADAVGGKYFTLDDFRVGYWEMLKNLPSMLHNLGNPNVDNWMVAAMQYNQLSKSNSEIFGRSDQSKWSRLLSQVRMGGYTLADYMINTMIVGATYNHYRLIEIPDGTGKKYMSKSDAVRVFTKFGYSEKEAISKWEDTKETLKQAYTVKDGVFTVKSDYDQYINKKLENQIAGRLRDRTAVYNGVIPSTEKAKIQNNVFGSFLTLMRNFYVNTYWERASSGYDYANEEELMSSKFGMYTADSAGYVNFETGEFGNGLWFSALKGLYKYITNVKALITGKDLRQLTADQKYAVKRIMTEVLIIGAMLKIMLFSIALARTHDYDDDKDPMWTLNIFDPEGEDRGLLEFNGTNAGDKALNYLRWKLALLSTRTFTERITFFWPGTVTELISSPSTAKSYLDDLGYSLQLFMDLFEINGHDRNELIKSGGYKGMTRGTRDIMKITGATGLDNVIRNWHTSGIKSTLNWYSGIAPNNILIPNKSTWEEEQGIKNNDNNSNAVY